MPFEITLVGLVLTRLLILLYLLSRLRHETQCRHLLHKAFLHGLEAAIIPFFHVTTAKGSVVFGPFVDSTKAVQTAAVTLLYYLEIWPEKLVRGFAACMTSKHCNLRYAIIGPYLTPILDAKIASDVVCHALEMLDYRQRHSSVPLPAEVFGSLLMTIGIVGHTSADMQTILQDAAVDFSLPPPIVIGTEGIMKSQSRGKSVVTKDGHWDGRHQISMVHEKP